MTAFMSTHVVLSDEPIDQQRWQDRLNDPVTGAHIWFHGVTRSTTRVGDTTIPTESLFYEAHQTMAEAQLTRIAEAAITRFDLAHVVVVHRLGTVAIGESSILVGCSAPHREPSFEAARWIMNEIKRDVPIWKRETGPSGPDHWVHPENDS